MKAKYVVMVIWIALLISLGGFTYYSTSEPLYYGGSSAQVQVGVPEVFNYYTPTLPGYTLRISITANDGPIRFYIVASETYNATSGGTPSTFLLNYFGDSTIIMVRPSNLGSCSIAEISVVSSTI